MEIVTLAGPIFPRITRRASILDQLEFVIPRMPFPGPKLASARCTVVQSGGIIISIFRRIRLAG